MKLYLIGGVNSETIKQALEKNGIDVVRFETSISKAFEYISKNYIEYDLVLLTDQGVIDDYQNFKDLLEGFKKLLNQGTKFKFLTKDAELEKIFIQVVENDLRFSVCLTDQIKIPVAMLIDFCISDNSDNEVNNDSNQLIEDTVVLKKSRSIFSKIKSGLRRNEESNDSKSLGTKKQDAENPIFVSNNLKKIIAITGHRGSGVTSTVANIASVASDKGFSVMVVDMDTVYRGINLFFSKFGDEVELNSELAYSLIRCLMNPESYDVNSCKINRNLSIITLGYSVSCKERISEAMQYKRVLSLISLLKQKYNIVLIDLPLEVVKELPDIITQIDSIGLCVNNSLYSIINTVKAIEGSLSKDTLLFTTKSKVIVSKYNENNRYQGKKITPEFTSEILNALSGRFEVEYQNAGFVPYSMEFDLQTESGGRLSNTNNSYKNFYFNILKNLD